MASVVVNPDNVREFKDADAFDRWLQDHHDKAPEVWIKIHKKDSGLPSITALQAIDVVLCWGWIDAIRKSFDDRSFLQRYVPRGKKSIWSQINVDNVGRLITEGRMTAFGLAEVEAAQADGRWDRAYASGKDMKIPEDLLVAVEKEPAALETFQGLNAQNRFALAFRLHNLKTEVGRRKKIESFVNMLSRGETIYPQKVRAK